jgi:hypothetical protein
MRGWPKIDKSSEKSAGSLFKKMILLMLDPCTGMLEQILKVKCFAKDFSAKNDEKNCRK